MRHRALLRRAIGVLAALALLLALPLQAGMAMPMPDHAMAPGMAMPDAEATMSSCGGCAGDDGAGMAMGACVALCGSMLALPLWLITLPTLPIEQPMATVSVVEPSRGGPPDPYPPRPEIGRAHV